MRKERLALLIIGFMTTILVSSCGSGGSGEGDGSGDSTEVSITEMDDPADNDFLYSLPSPLQIASIFRRSGLDYLPGQTNDPNNADNYNTKFIQKLNFGVYAADLAYSALNDRNQDCISYVKTLSTLSESLWMTNVFSSVSILNRFENNMGNSDSLGYIIADFQMEMDSYLEENGLSANTLVIFSGAWIESMHLAFTSVQNNYNPQLISRLIEQKKIANSLIDILSKQEKDADLTILVNYLKKISAHFDKYDVANLKDETALFELTMTKEEAAVVAADIEEARTFIING